MVGGKGRRLVPRLSRDAWTVLAGDFVSALGTGLTLPFLLVYLSEVRGIEVGVAGLAVSTVALASFAGNPAGGWLSDRIGPRDALVTGVLVAAVGTLLIAGVHVPWQAFGAAAVIGFGAGIIWPAQDTLLAVAVGQEQRSHVFAVSHATLNAGFSIGALVAALIVDFGRPSTFVVLYVVDAATFLVYVPILLRVRAGARPQPKPQDAGAAPAGGFRAVLRDRTFLAVWALTALVVTITFGQFHSSIPLYAATAGGLAAGHISVMYLANTVVVVVAQLLVLRLLEGRRRTSALIVASGLWAVTYAVVLAGGRSGGGIVAVVLFASALAVFAVGETMLSPTLPPLVNDLATDELRGRYNGLSTLAWTTGFALGPALAGFAFRADREEELFLGLITACAVAAAGAAALARRLPGAANRISAEDVPVAAEADLPTSLVGDS